jgi:hypothetical protein
MAREPGGGPGEEDISSTAVPGVAVPLDLVAVGTRVIADHVAVEFGRPVVGQLVSQDVILHLQPAERLDTSGPVVCRQVQLVDAEAPRRAVAACWALVVADRLPDVIRAGLESGEPLDRLLTVFGSGWSAEVLTEEGAVLPAAEASVDLGWLGSAGMVVELSRLASIEGVPVAVLIDEVPLRSRPPVEAVPV